MAIDISKKSLCVFVHFGKTEFVPLYVQIYANEISLYFDEVVFVTNNRAVSLYVSMLYSNISIKFVKNEGYDFGMFYKVFKSIDPSEYKQIACINDSNVLFNKLTSIFEWGQSMNYDFWGLVDSREKPYFSTYLNNYHIQSHFFIFNEKAIRLLPEYFRSINIENLFNENDLTALKISVITHWEIGISQFMAHSGISMGSYICSKHYSNFYLRGKIRNVLIRLYPQLIRSGLPLIKKSIIYKPKMKHFWKIRASWKRLIRKHGNPEWDIEKLIVEMENLKNR